MGYGHGGFLLRPRVAVAAEAADQAVVLGTGRVLVREQAQADSISALAR